MSLHRAIGLRNQNIEKFLVFAHIIDEFTSVRRECSYWIPVMVLKFFTWPRLRPYLSSYVNPLLYFK
jgi:hypothetical protein